MKLLQYLMAGALVMGALSAHAEIISGISGVADEDLQGMDWKSRVGVQGLYVPKFSGANNYEWRAFPLIDIQWHDTLFLNSMRGVGAQFNPINNVHVGAAINYDWGRDDSDDRHLNGLGDVDGSFEGGVFAAYQLADWRIEADVYRALQEKGYDGVHGKVGLANVQRFIDDRLILTVAGHASFADDNYMKAYYGVTPLQSYNSGLRAYTPDSGFYKVGANVTAGFGLTRLWAINMVVGYNRLIEDAGNSPVVQDVDQYRFGVGSSFRF